MAAIAISDRMTAGLKKTLKSAVGWAAGAAGIMARRSRKTMTIIAFHRVNDGQPEDGLTCGVEKFTAFCRFFRDQFKVVPLSEQVEGCRLGADMGSTLSVTFDDGYVDNFTVAAPVLRRLDIPATFFVTTGFIGTSVVAPWDGNLKTPQQWMSWDQVRQLAAVGFDIGCHTDGHVNLSTTGLAAARADLETSKRTLERELGGGIRYFAYPFGGRNDISAASRELVRELGFECCLSCFGGVNSATADPFFLQRIGIGNWFSSPHQFALEYILRRI